MRTSDLLTALAVELGTRITLDQATSGQPPSPDVLHLLRQAHAQAARPARSPGADPLVRR